MQQNLLVGACETTDLLFVEARKLIETSMIHHSTTTEILQKHLFNGLKVSAEEKNN